LIKLIYIHTETVPPKIYTYLFFTPEDLIEFVENVFELDMFFEIVSVEFIDFSVKDLPPIFKYGITSVTYSSFVSYYTEFTPFEHDVINIYNTHVDSYNCDFSKIVNDLYVGAYDSVQDYVIQFYEDVYYAELNALPNLLRNSIDWETVTDNFMAESNYYYIEETGYLFSGD